ncbi:MAG: protein translocase subunit SecF [Defluviitaleaceae bacterium]|nr:protein translocase subunit SecF [Defluviitaleaceae bacterium]
MLRIIENRAKFFIISAALIGAGIVAMIMNASAGNGAFNLDVDFTGGISIHYDAARTDYSNDDIVDIIRSTTSLDAAQVQRIIGTTEVSIRMRELDAVERNALLDALADFFPNGELLDMDVISPTVSGEMQRTAITAFLLACALMLVYITFRFKDIRTGGTTILGLVHDGLIVLAAYAILRIPLNTAFIAAILTVIGYSINATIVIFDRLRENKALMKKSSNAELMNTSVTQTLKRSIYTSLSTLFTVVCLYILGVSSVRDFTLPIIVGIISGTYSSTCLVGPIWYELSKDKKDKKAPQA